ncbi:MAG: hypothetical protein QF918_06075, partial [Pirellulaceae bacterium]|nr:hypothetical protein [Pirellulaceae bacterium]
MCERCIHGVAPRESGRHSVQIGTLKACVILGIRLCTVPYPQRALRFEDMHVIAVIPVEQSTG